MRPSLALVCLLAAFMVLNADAHTLKEDAEGEAYETGSRLFTAKSSVPPASAQHVSMSLGEDGETATVHFTIGNKSHQYELTRFSIYAEGADAKLHTDEGAEPLDIESAQSFGSRVDGKWATARLEDGEVSGLFEDGDHIMELRPHSDPKFGEFASLIGIVTPDTVSAGMPHFVWHHRFADINLAASISLDKKSLLQTPTKPATKNPKAAPTKSHYKIAVDKDHVDKVGKHHIFEIPKGADAPHDEYSPMSAAKDVTAQSLVKWWPGCYSGDSAMHTFTMGVIADQPAFAKYGAGTQKAMEKDVSEASLVYEKQFHVALKIGSSQIYKTSDGPSYAQPGCGGGGFMQSKLRALQSSQQTFQGAVHLFTGCGTGYGVIGIAYVGTICIKGYNCGVNQLYSQNSWLTFAHELGHNFDGKHSFELGQGKTGGIMDYADGKLDGVYQFNTRFRKTKMCAQMNKIGTCQGKFVKGAAGGGGGGKAPAPPRRRTATPPAPTPPGGKCSAWGACPCKNGDAPRRRRGDKEQGRRRRRRTATPPSPPPPPPPAYADPDAATWLLAHNYFRCIHDTPAIKWDDDVAAGSAEWAQKGQMSHSDCYKIPPPRGPTGENLGAGYGDILTVVTAWYNENPERGYQCGGHCTALLFKASTALGCSKKNTYNGNRPMYVCRYAKSPANFGKNSNSVNMPDYSKEPACYKKFPVAKRWQKGAAHMVKPEGHVTIGKGISENAGNDSAL